MDAVSQIKQKLDIVDVVGGYVPLKKAGKNYKAACPFHAENTPSFMVSPELQIFKCFGCNEAGDIFSFVQKIEGVEFPAALEVLAERAGVKLERGEFDAQAQAKKKIFFINELAVKFYHHILVNHKAGRKGLDYLKKERKLTLETINEFMLGYAPDIADILYRFLRKNGFSDAELLLAGVIVEKREGKGFMDKFRGRILFPLTGIDGKVVGFTGRTVFGREPKYLNTGETPVFHKTYFLYALDKAKMAIKRQGAVFVEGQTDVLSAHQRGIKNVVASSGTSLTENQLKLLGRYTKDIVFCFDSDPAGVNAAFRGVELAERQNFNVKVAVIPEGFKDLDELLLNKPEKAKKVLEDPAPAYDFFLASIVKKYDKTTALGKKQIMDELAPIFSRVSNKVMFEHYSKKISEELSVSEDTVGNVLSEYKQKGAPASKSTSSEDSAFTSFRASLDAESVKPGSTAALEYYILAIFLGSPVDIVRDIVYKLESKDFLNERSRRLFDALFAFIGAGKRKFGVAKFINGLPDDLKALASDLHMRDLGDLLNDRTKLVKELKSTTQRVKKEAARVQLRDLSEEIKAAELRDDKKLLEKLTKRFKKLSKKML